jgi:hypothetical protein
MAEESKTSDSMGIGFITAFAVFLFAELGLTTWNLLRGVDHHTTKSE